ncbi:preprotein translocase subunit SecE [Thermospira aquatica]|uniref:Protein translocase subunit SecE n=1 Tax=Thermospira aquatica TaxID=2828656 RepID=A0AAX3BEQ0_9SPIR|nr:preprotein translocase subunit SecE [Thermospira aquatica]URA10725.1 preprotein translocase subunit SecE [Thermospira aquatica]
MTTALMSWIIIGITALVAIVVLIVNRNFVKEAREELRKVTWPTKEFAIQGAWVTVVFIVVLAAFLSLIDWGVNTLIMLSVK